MAWLPDTFVVPTTLTTERFSLYPLTIHDVVRDYDAVMTSQPELWAHFGRLWGWPRADLSLEQDLIDLAWHQKEAQRRTSFAYAVMNPMGTQQVGCVYIEPPLTDGFDAAVLYWVRTSELTTGLEEVLEQAVRQWLAEQWCFDHVEYPGRAC